MKPTLQDEAFMVGLTEVLQIDEVGPGIVLNDENWDSLAIMSAIALIDEHYNLTVSGKALQGCSSVADLLSLVHSTVAERERAGEG